MLDNNALEQRLRHVVLNRKNWNFYKTELGALVGDMLLSIIKTCEERGENPFDYLVWIQKNAEEIRKNPGAFMPGYLKK